MIYTKSSLHYCLSLSLLLRRQLLILNIIFMLQLQVIGNIGADAELRQSNGGEYVTFRVAHTEQFKQNGQQVTRSVWVDVSLNGNAGQLLSYLRKGAKVFVSGTPTFRIYSSAKDKCMKCGVSIFARTVELCGGSSDAVPRELITRDGIVVPINKWFHCPVNEAWNSVLLDKSLNEYKVDENGFITTTTSEKSSETTDEGRTVSAESNTDATAANVDGLNAGGKKSSK